MDPRSLVGQQLGRSRSSGTAVPCQEMRRDKRRLPLRDAKRAAHRPGFELQQPRKHAGCTSLTSGLYVGSCNAQERCFNSTREISHVGKWQVCRHNPTDLI